MNHEQILEAQWQIGEKLPALPRARNLPGSERGSQMPSSAESLSSEATATALLHEVNDARRTDLLGLAERSRVCFVLPYCGDLDAIDE